MVNKIATKIRSALLKIPQVEYAYLFGSFSAGKAKKNSDVDVAVMLSSKLTQKQRFDLRLELMGVLSKALKKPLDVVILNNISSIFLKYVIIQEGKPIYIKDELKYLAFESQTLGEYFDFAPFLETYNHYYVQKYA